MTGAIMLSILFLALPSIVTAESQSSASALNKREHSIPEWWIRIIYAHGILACLVWVILIPLGAILFRMIKGRKSLWVHAIIQIVSLAAYIGAVGMGIWMAKNFHLLDSAHAIIGLVVFCLAMIQPSLGIYHHIIFMKPKHHSSTTTTPTLNPSPTNSTTSTTSTTTPIKTSLENSHSPSPIHAFIRTTIPGVVHRYVGRITLTLGMINGGLGIRLQGRANRAECIAYGVVAGVIWIGYLLVVGGTFVRRKTKDARNGDGDENEEKRMETGQRSP